MIKSPNNLNLHFKILWVVVLTNVYFLLFKLEHVYNPVTNN